jgi:predicted secreted protein
MDNLNQRIQEGLDGKYQGLDNGFVTLNKYIFGVQRSTYYLIGGSSGTYKTTLLDYIVRNAIRSSQEQQIECNVFYYSFEIDKISKMCNWTSSIIYQTYGIVIPPEKIKGLGNFRLTAEEQQLVFKTIPIVEQMAEIINFRFESINPTGIFNELWKFATDNGKIIYEEYKDHDDKVKKRIVGYTPNNPNAYNLIALDHLYLLRKERGFQTKEVMDKMSEYFVLLRNLFKFTPIVLQQFNQGLSGIDRQKFKGIDLSPSQGDFKDTTNPYQDADIVMGIMCPFKLDMKTSLGYDVEKLKDRMLMLKIIKNRLSRDNVAKGLYVKPESGKFFELPEPDDLEINKYYNKQI